MQQTGEMHYSRSLDGLRAVAALTVAAYHAKTPSMPGGFLGVDLFFVLSGYLITRLLIDEYRSSATVDLSGFMARRLRRLYPALLLLVAVYLVIAQLVFTDVHFARHLLDAMWTLLYISNYSSVFDQFLSILGHVWSLAVEVQFYVLWPILFLLLARLPRPLILFVMIMLYLAATGWRWWRFEFSDPWLIYTGTDTRCSGLILGCLLAYLRPQLHHYWSLVGILALLFSVNFFNWPWDIAAHIGFSIAEWGAALLIAAPPAWLGAPVLVWLGRISYGFYLWHYLIMRMLQEWGWHWLAVLVVGVALGLIGASLSYHFIEHRFHSSRVRRNTVGDELAGPRIKPV